MEIYALYNSFFTSILVLLINDLDVFGLSFTQSHFLSLGIALLVWLVFFVLQGIGLFTMAKNRKMPKKWMAFVPFANLLFMGKLAGECNVFGQKIKRAGLYVMLAQILITLYSVLIMSAMTYLLLVEGEPVIAEYGFDWVNSSQFSQTLENFYNFSVFGAAVLGFFTISLLSIVQFIYEILMLILTMSLYRKYCPKAYVWLALLTVFVPFSRYIVIFVIRNRKEIDWQAYMRARQEEYMRRQQQYRNTYGNPYNNPYGNPYNNPYGNGNPYGSGTPYNQPQNNTEKPQEPDEPFAEFDSDKKQKKGGGNSDEFFH